MRSTIAVMMVMGWLGYSHAAEGKNIPEGADGFSGLVTCTVKAVKEKELTVKITKIQKLWKNNKAKNAEVLIGKTIRVNEGWHKDGNTGKYKPNEYHVRFMAKQKKGKTLSLEIHTGDGDRFHILELNKEQRVAGGWKPKKPKKEAHDHAGNDHDH